MAEIASLWSYEENGEMEQLGEKLMWTTLELEKLKAEAVEEMRKNKECISQLIQLLKHAVQERDEARNQFQKLLNKTIPATPIETFPSMPLLKPTKAISSITESNSLSETHNLHSHSHASSTVSSPDFSNGLLNVNTVPKLDKESMILDNLANTAVPPQKGKFLQTVLQAGPLLQTLLVAGPLPRWRNPPQIQSSQIPAFSIKACESDVFNRKPASCGSPQVHSAPLLSFGTCLSSGLLIPPAMNADGFAPLNKRQRLS